MKKLFLIFSISMATCLLLIPDLDARGGRGGGGRGGGGRRGGGGGRGGGGFHQSHRSTNRNIHRSPSMSRVSQSRPQTKHHSQRQRPSTRQGTPRTGQRHANRTPTRNDVQNFLNKNPSRPTNRPSTQPVERPNRRPEGRPTTRPNERPNRRPGDRPTTLPGERPGRNPGDRGDLGQNIRDQIGQNRPDRGDWFNGDFWDKHHHRPPYYDHNHNWWRGATVVGVAGWLGWRSAPVYYGYYSDDSYYWDPSYTTSEPQDYVEQTEYIEEATTEDTSDEWMPLGVFAISKDQGVTTTPNVYLQMALNKDGLLSGTYYNTLTDETHEAEGVVDQKSQRAAWKVVDNDSSPILETGIYDLTESEVPVRVNFQDGRTQDMMLIRLEDPKG